MNLYLDTSVLVPLHIEEDNSETTQVWFQTQVQSKVTSDFALAEFNSALSRLVRKRTMSDLDAAEIRSDFEAWFVRSMESVRVDSADVASAAKLVCTPLPKLLVPDAVHLALCKRMGYTLVTFDKDLFAIAKREGVDALIPA